MFSGLDVAEYKASMILGFGFKGKNDWKEGHQHKLDVVYYFVGMFKESLWRASHTVNQYIIV